MRNNGLGATSPRVVVGRAELAGVLGTSGYAPKQIAAASAHQRLG